MSDPVTIRLLDMDGVALTHAEKRLHRYLREYGVAALVEPVPCHLEISRQGLTGHTPALQVNGYTVAAGRPLDDALLEDCCRRLRDWQRQRDATAP